MRDELAQPQRPLTPRQEDVAALIAEGLTNREIAERTGLTPGTVANHVEQILKRLGFRTRTQVATWVVQREARSPRRGRSRAASGGHNSHDGRAA